MLGAGIRLDDRTGELTAPSVTSTNSYVVPVTLIR
jgi:hypothetical protein